MMKGKRPSEAFIAAGVASKRGRQVSPETREKIASAQRGRPKNPDVMAILHAARAAWVPTPQWLADNAARAAARRGKKRDPEIGKKISAAKMGHPVSAETRAKISATRRARGDGA